MVRWLGFLCIVLTAMPAFAEEEAKDSFTFGSYGRLVAGSDLNGGGLAPVKVIAHAPRLLEKSYAELDFSYALNVPSTGAEFTTYLTLALGEALFHFNGDFRSDIAIRNLYVEAKDALGKDISVWAGSRMYRGDDIYLLDFWPLDEQNTVGGGIRYVLGKTAFDLHAGFNQLDDDFQFQEVMVEAESFGTRSVVYMNRQRLVVSARAEHHEDLFDTVSGKAIVYSEFHHIGEGRRVDEQQLQETLPADSGILVGAEVGLYEKGTPNFLNLFIRLGQGLAAFDELGVPYGLNTEKKATGAHEMVLGLSGNWEPNSNWALLSGAYARQFVDADPNIYDRDDTWEAGFAIRPAWQVSEHFQMVAELNGQYLRPNGIAQESGEQDMPFVLQGAIVPTISLGRGSFSRPQLRLIYSISHLNADAQRTYAPQDPLRSRSVQHFVGVGIEWWLNSSRYSAGR
ncbi:MAG: hypothetical protein HOK97_20485 [Deltaproteobacteria bacterium]|jgi:maltoporin|nr:hypothetical protein [Deltaproteobacteria bacterium]